MPLIRPGMPKPPPGFEAIHAKLEAFEEQMKLATQEESKGVVGEVTRPQREGARKRPRKAEEGEGDDGATALVGGASATSAVPDTATPTQEEADKPMPPLWRMAGINRARTRYVFLAYYREHAISKEVYDYCVAAQLIDGGLARRWRLPGYERLCCTTCGVPGAASLAATMTSKYALRDHRERRVTTAPSGSSARSGDSATCICRVPAAQRESKRFLACAVCGCRGCCSADAPKKEEGGNKGST